MSKAASCSLLWLSLVLFIPLDLTGPLVAATATAVTLDRPGNPCPALPLPEPPIVTVTSEAALREQAYQAAPGTTILIASGTYQMGSYVHVVNKGLTLRGGTGERGDVILEVNQEAVSDVGEFGAAIKNSEKGALLLVRRGNAEIFVPLKRQD